MNTPEQTYVGIPASPGLAIGEAFLFESLSLEIPRYPVTDSILELERLKKAREKAAIEIDGILQAATKNGLSEAAVFDAHKMFIEDPALLEIVEMAVQNGLNAEAAWMDSIQQFAAELAQLPDPTLRERAADVNDVGRRVLGHLLGKQDPQMASFAQPVIVIARDLAPSQTALLDKRLVLAFCTAAGGATSHTAILAKALGIPAVVGLGEPVLSLGTGTPLLVEGSQGLVIACPGAETLAAFQDRAQGARQVAASELEQAGVPAITRDGRQVEVVANVGGVADTLSALKFGAEGIGLLRTEFLFLERTRAPDENEQAAAYRAILELMQDRPVTVRTLDAGGDKPIPYLKLGQEANPFLGLRAIRLCLQEPELFKVQLRALLRAGLGHNLRIMFPMIATLDEVKEAKKLLAEAREELERAGAPCCQDFQTGIMFEIPSVAWMADEFARQVDFFSVGTNDLTQYTFAAERNNERVAYLGDACHPAILRQIRQIITAGHQAGCWIGVCGELAGDPDAVPILLGLGLDEFSMSPSSIPHAKAILRSWTYPDAVGLAEAALKLEFGGSRAPICQSGSCQEMRKI